MTKSKGFIGFSNVAIILFAVLGNFIFQKEAFYTKNSKLRWVAGNQFRNNSLNVCSISWFLEIDFMSNTFHFTDNKTKFSFNFVSVHVVWFVGSNKIFLCCVAFLTVILLVYKRWNYGNLIVRISLIHQNKLHSKHT